MNMNLSHLSRTEWLLWGEGVMLNLHHVMGNQDGASTCLGHQPAPLLRHGKGGRVLGLCWLSPCSLRCTFICLGLCRCVSARVYSCHSMHSISPTCPSTRPTQGNAGSQSVDRPSSPPPCAHGVRGLTEPHLWAPPALRMPFSHS